MRDAAPQPRGRAPKPFEFSDQAQGEFEAVRRAAIREPALCVPPHALVRVEFGRVSRQVLQVQSRHATAELLHELALVDAEVVPDQDDVPAQVPQQMAEERDGFDLADVVVVSLVVQADPTARRADRDAGDHRDTIVSLRVPEDRRLAARRPGAHHGRREHEAGLVHEDEVGLQSESPLFTRGHRVRFQRAMAASSRSRARRSGFCGLQSLRASRRLTWAR